MDPAGVLRLDGDALLVTLRLTPRGGRDAIEGVAALADGRRVVKARVRAAPEDGAANAAAAALLAAAAGRPKSSAAVIAGHGARIKTVRIEGAGVAGLQALAALIADR